MKTLYKLFMLIGVLTIATACNKDPEYYTLEDQPDEMHVAINTPSVRLTAAHINEEAIKLTWTPIQSTDSVSYMVRFYATDNKNEDVTEFFEVGKNTEFSITHNDLNSIVARWAIPGEEVNVTAQVVGTVHNPNKYLKPEVSIVDFKATGWEKYPEHLYLYTSLSGSPTTLSQRKLGTGVYEATVKLSPCTYHFSKFSYTSYPAYYMGTDGKLQYVESEGTYTEFNNTLPAGTYTIIVDVNDQYLDSRILNIQIPAGATPSVVGDGTDIGWNTKVAASYMTLTTNPRTPYIYTWTAQFYAPKEFPNNANSEGTFKILLNDNFGGEGFFAPENNTNPLENHILKPARTQGSQDYKWLVPKTGKYTFTIDVYNMTTSFEPVI